MRFCVGLSRVCPTPRYPSTLLRPLGLERRKNLWMNLAENYGNWRKLYGWYVDGRKISENAENRESAIECKIVNSSFQLHHLKYAEIITVHVRLYATLPRIAKLVLWSLLNCWRWFCDFLAVLRLHPFLEPCSGSVKLTTSGRLVSSFYQNKSDRIKRSGLKNVFSSFRA